ncbi:MAG: lipid III flippase WzxE [Pantoea sp.]|nr:lipid III flippase WzxE [Pantoea sp.]
MSLAKASVWTAASTLVKIVSGLLVVKLLAVSFGPEGVGQAGNFRQLITVLGVLAGAGIFNGVTKYVAEHQHQPLRLAAVTGTASAMVLSFSLLVAVVFLLAAAPISQALFGHDRYQDIIRIVAFLQMGIAWANLALAIMKGFRDALGNALSLMAGSVIGVIGYVICYWCDHLPLRALLPRWHGDLARQLAKFTLMALITSATLPIAWMMMRNLLAARYSWQEVGLWQGVTTISDAWLQFITATFSVWLLPTLSRLNAKQDISREIFRTLRFVLPLVAAVGFCVWLLRDVAIWLLFSSQFHGMRDLFVWQLIGDVLKVGAYVFGYLVIAKASLRFYIAAELSQFILLTAFSRWLIPLSGATGAAQAYMATYIVYFALCLCAFLIYRRRV